VPGAGSGGTLLGSSETRREATRGRHGGPARPQRYPLSLTTALPNARTVSLRAGEFGRGECLATWPGPNLPRDLRPVPGVVWLWRDCFRSGAGARAPGGSCWRGGAVVPAADGLGLVGDALRCLLPLAKPLEPLRQRAKVRQRGAVAACPLVFAPRRTQLSEQPLVGRAARRFAGHVNECRCAPAAATSLRLPQRGTIGALALRRHGTVGCARDGHGHALRRVAGVDAVGEHAAARAPAPPGPLTGGRRVWTRGCSQTCSPSLR
jgi:hypothetical protein